MITEIAKEMPTIFLSDQSFVSFLKSMIEDKIALTPIPNNHVTVIAFAVAPKYTHLTI